MSSSSNCDPDFPPLTGEEARTACSNQILFYPQVVRSDFDDPIESQTRGLVSFMLPKTSVQTKEGKRLLGFFKLRGNWRDDNQAVAKASSIVRNQDSKYPVRVAHVGAWIPIIDDEAMAKKQINVNVEESESQEAARRKAEEEEEAKRNRIMKELKEREEEVKNGKDYNDDKTHIDYYTMKMVTWMRLQENLEAERKKVRDLETKLVETRRTLGELDESHPTYSTDWVDNYNFARRKAGIPDFVPSEAQMRLYAADAKPTEAAVATVVETPK